MFRQCLNIMPQHPALKRIMTGPVKRKGPCTLRCRDESIRVTTLFAAPLKEQTLKFLLLSVSRNLC